MAASSGLYTEDERHAQLSVDAGCIKALPQNPPHHVPSLERYMNTPVHARGPQNISASPVCRNNLERFQSLNYVHPARSVFVICLHMRSASRFIYTRVAVGTTTYSPTCLAIACTHDFEVGSHLGIPPFAFLGIGSLLQRLSQEKPRQPISRAASVRSIAPTCTLPCAAPARRSQPAITGARSLVKHGPMILSSIQQLACSLVLISKSKVLGLRNLAGSR
jgi:hypothetical protein